MKKKLPDSDITPFSASISLKSSFVKRFRDDPITTNQHFESLANEDMEHLGNKDLNEENLALTAKVKDLENRIEIIHEGFEKERIQLKTVYDMEKDKVEVLEKQICGLREELLNVKNEKQKVPMNLKAEQKHSEAIQT